MATVAAAVCAPVAWPLLAGGAVAGPAALTAAFGQVGGLGGGLLSEAVIRAWDRLRKEPGAGEDELREALAAELKDALTSSSQSAAELRAEVAGELQGVDAVKVALTATIRESGDQVREVLIRGLYDLGSHFTEFGWLLHEVNDQVAVIVETQAEIAADSRAILAAQQQALMHLIILRQQTRPAGGVPVPVTGMSADEEGATGPDAADVPVALECPYPGLAAFGPQDFGRFFGREKLTAALLTRLAEQLARPGLLMVLGPSGSGKSSLLRAGLMPAVAAGELPARGSEAWPVELMTPTQRPLLELSAHVAGLAGIVPGALDADLHIDPPRIAGAIRQGLLAHARRGESSRGPGRRPGSARNPG